MNNNQRRMFIGRILCIILLCTESQATQDYHKVADSSCNYCIEKLDKLKLKYEMLQKSNSEQKNMLWSIKDELNCQHANQIVSRIRDLKNSAKITGQSSGFHSIQSDQSSYLIQKTKQIERSLTLKFQKQYQLKVQELQRQYLIKMKTLQNEITSQRLQNIEGKQLQQLKRIRQHQIELQMQMESLKQKIKPIVKKLETVVEQKRSNQKQISSSDQLKFEMANKQRIRSQKMLIFFTKLVPNWSITTTTLNDLNLNDISCDYIQDILKNENQPFCEQIVSNNKKQCQCTQLIQEITKKNRNEFQSQLTSLNNKLKRVQSDHSQCKSQLSMMRNKLIPLQNQQRQLKCPSCQCQREKVKIAQLVQQNLRINQQLKIIENQNRIYKQNQHQKKPNQQYQDQRRTNQQTTSQAKNQGVLSWLHYFDSKYQAILVSLGSVFTSIYSSYYQPQISLPTDAVHFKVIQSKSPQKIDCDLKKYKSIAECYSQQWIQKYGQSQTK